MDKLVPVYEVQLPINGQPLNYFTVCRAVTADGAAEVVRIILMQGDRDVTEVRVMMTLREGPVEAIL